MNKIIIFFIFFLFQYNIYSQEFDFRTRSIKQQNYILDYSKEHELLGKHFISTEEIEQRVKILSDGWNKQTISNDPVLKRFDGYPLLLISNIAGNDRWVQEYLFIKYMAPNLIEDIKYIKKNSFSPSLYLLNVPTYANITAFSLTTDMNRELWNELYNSLKSLPSIIESALDKHIFEEDFEKTLMSIREILLDSEKQFELLNAIYNDNLDLGFTLLFTAFSQGSVVKDELVRPGKLLVDKFIAGNRNEQAFATLDLLSQSTIEEELSRDSLKAWYLNVDRHNGEAKFYSANKKSNSSILIRSEDCYELSGTYLNLTEDEKFDLSDVKNKYILIDFWATWCGPCKVEIPNLNQFHSFTRSEKDIVFISVVCDAVTKGAKIEDIKKYIKQNHINYIVLYDTEEKSLAKQFDVSGYPSKFLLDKEGYILERTPGIRTIDLSIAEAFFRKLVE